MFETSLINLLRGDSTLTDDLSTYDGSPSVFPNKAPKKVDFNYIVFSVHGAGTEDSVIENFNIFVNFFAYDLSGVVARNATRRVVELLDRTHLDHNYYDNIRIFSTGGIDYMETNDLRSQHYNARFIARAGRSGWMRNL